MAKYVVAYDLMKQGQNYECIIAKIKQYGTWAHVQESVWFIVTNDTATQVRDNLQSCLDANDKLIVAGLTGEAAWIGHSQEISDWLKQNL
jgi:CRISPR/Cas system-associated endoribonuclease Cas2